MSLINLDAYRSIQSSGVNLANMVRPSPTKPPAEMLEAHVVQPSKEELISAVAHLNQYIASAVSSIEFSVDDDSGKTVIKVVDSETRKVLRQIPNAEALSLSKSLDRVEGLIIKQKV